MNIKRLMRGAYRYIVDADFRFLVRANRGRYLHMSDEEFLKRKYRALFKKKLNLEFPKSFNEKLQWLKLHNRNPLYTIMVDKYLVRKYIGEVLGEEYLIPLVGAWDSVDEIDFDALPDQFVLKCNHNSGLGMCICKDKSKLDMAAAKRELKKGLMQDYYLTGREWPYKNVPRKIIAEQYMEDAGSSDLKDYKFMCFNGRVRCSFVCSDRFSGKGLHVTFFDREWNVMPFERSYPSVKEGIEKPKSYEKMVYLAEILSADIPFVRVDFYEINGKIYFGELTFFPGDGFEAFQPEEWDYTLGSWLDLPTEKKG